jgi:hypothetical protein
VWPEQTDRFAILRQAVEIARAEPVRIVEGDLTRDLATVAQDAPRDATLVVFHSAVLSYLDQQGRSDFRNELAELGEQRDVVWISNEGPGVVADVAIPDGGAVPFVVARNAVPLAYADPHGGALDWFG